MDITISDRIRQVTRKNSTLKYVLKNKWLYIFLLPMLVYYVIFHYAPIYGVLIAFKDYKFRLGIMGSPWVGFEHFKAVFESSGFWEVFRNSIVLSIYRLLWGFPVPILMALIINEVKDGIFKRFSQTVVYLPHFISWVIVAGMVMNLLSSSDGLVNQFIKNMTGSTIPFLDSPKYFRTTLIVVEVWKAAGWGSIIYLAALTGINPELYEAAIVDGATRIQRMFYITLPGIASTVAVMLILRMGSLIRNGFEEIFLLYNPLVYSVADVIETYVYRVGILEGRYSYTTAVGLFQSVIALILIVTSNRLSKKMGGGGLY